AKSPKLLETLNEILNLNDIRSVIVGSSINNIYNLIVRNNQSTGLKGPNNHIQTLTPIKKEGNTLLREKQHHANHGKHQRLEENPLMNDTAVMVSNPNDGLPPRKKVQYINNMERYAIDHQIIVLDLLLSDIFPKGWKVLPLFRVIHHSKEIYPEHEKFNLSRIEAQPRLNTYLAFDTGGHLCPRSELVKLEILVLLHHLTNDYRWEVIGEEEGIQYGSFPVPKGGLPPKMTHKE
ncbi:hypothetical protein GIB67_022090, partial [Kingdonia uniflora]